MNAGGQTPAGIGRTLAGIDLGTTMSVLALAGETGAEVIRNRDGSPRTPSAVCVASDGSTIVGQAALREATLAPDSVFEHFKRDMGTDASYRTPRGSWTPVELSAQVLASLRTDAETHLGGPLGEVVITVPAYFGEDARRDTMQAAEQAGLATIELIHEPTAAALAYGARVADGDRTVLVYDLGGGTFDVSVVRFAGDAAEVLATAGDHRLGGKDWDEVLMSIMRERVEAAHGVDPFDELDALAELRDKAREAKHALSQLPRATVAIVAGPAHQRLEIERETFEAASAPLLERTERLVEQVLGDIAGVRIDEAILVGGSTRMAACAPLLARITGLAPRPGVDPDQAVALGAARYAWHLGRERSGSAAAARPTGGFARLKALQDITSHALGFVVVSADGQRYLNEVMIPRNAPIPARAAKTRRLEAPAGSVAELNVYLLQGESARPLDTEPLGRWSFPDVPVGRDGHVEIEVLFGYDRDGIVEISARAAGRELAGPRIDREDRDVSWTEQSPQEHLAAGALTVVLLIDCSDSMCGEALSQAKRACIGFAEELAGHPHAQLGLISFATGARIVRRPQAAATGMAAAVNGLCTYGGTDMAAGLRQARELLAGVPGRRAVVLLTDGYPNSQQAALREAQALAGEEVEIHPRGVTGADEAFLRQMAHGDGDLMTDLDGLAGSFRGIARQLAGSIGRRQT
jgi:molecular chaperone DnaK